MTDTALSAPAAEQQSKGEGKMLIDEPDQAFGSIIDWLITNGFQRVENLAPERRHRYYTECKLCGGNDINRKHARTTTSGVTHSLDCEFAKHLPRLRSLANEGVT